MNDTRPSFVVEDQSAVIAFLEVRLGAQKRIDTHGAVVFLAGDRAAVKIIKGIDHMGVVHDPAAISAIADDVATTGVSS